MRRMLLACLLVIVSMFLGDSALAHVRNERTGVVYDTGADYWGNSGHQLALWSAVGDAQSGDTLTILDSETNYAAPFYSSLDNITITVTPGVNVQIGPGEYPISPYAQVLLLWGNTGWTITGANAESRIKFTEVIKFMNSDRPAGGLKIQYCDFTGLGTGISIFYYNEPWASEVVGGIQILDCNFATGKSGIYVVNDRPGVPGIEVAGCEFRNCGQSGYMSGPITVLGMDAHIHHNRILGVKKEWPDGSFGIRAAGNEVLIHHNLVYDIPGEWGGGIATSGGICKVYNNTLDQCGTGTYYPYYLENVAIRVGHNWRWLFQGTAIVENNIISGGQVGLKAWKEPAAHVISDYNLFYEVEHNLVFADYKTKPGLVVDPGPHDYYGGAAFDPQYVSPGPPEYDYNLSLGSPAITASSTGAYIGAYPGPLNQQPVANAGGPYAAQNSTVLVDIDPDTLNIRSQGKWVTAYLKANSGGTATVQLDGSGSFDPDGDVLSYAWTIRTVDDQGNEVEVATAEGAQPTVKLPVGTFDIALLVNDGNVDSNPDYSSITVVLVNLVTVYPTEITLHGPLPGEAVFGEWGEMQDAETLMVKFSRANLIPTLIPEASNVITVGGAVNGQDIIMVIDRGEGKGKK